jgi:putative peptidoglycan lipid II flippase
MARRSLMAYALGLTPFIMIKVLAPGFYARQDTKTPVRFAVIAMVSNMVLNLILVFPLAHAGLALATTLSATLNAGLLFSGLLRERVYRPVAGWPRLLAQGLAASLVLGLLLYFASGETADWVVRDSWSRIWWLCGLILAGAAAYFITLFAVGVRLRDFQGR